MTLELANPNLMNHYHTLFSHTFGFTAQTLLTRAEGKLKLPRTSLTIMNGISMAFPEESVINPKNIRLIDDFAPLMIATNELADIGVSARLKRQVKQRNFYPLFELEKMIRMMHGEIQASFTNRYPQHADTARAFSHDLETLSTSRNTFESEEDTFLEFDSAIFEGACIALVAPRILEELDFDYSALTTSPLELRLKYEPFMLKNPILDSGILGRLQALHAVEMLLKIDDDTRGAYVDALLGLPSFVSWAKKTSLETGKSVQQILDDKRNTYTTIAVAAGYLPKVVVNGIRKLCEVTSVLKAENHQIATNIPLIQHPYFRSFSTTLRHELTQSGTMDLFLSQG